MFKLFKKQVNINDYLYKDCYELMMDQFIDCFLNNNFRRLIKTQSKLITEQYLLNKWEQIFEEYCNLTATKHYKALFKNRKEHTIVYCKLFTIETCLLTLSKTYSKVCINELKRLGYVYDFDYTNKEAFLNDLEAINKRKEALLMQFKRLEKEYADIVGEQKNNVVDNNYFDKQLIILNKWKGGEFVHLKDISVTEYCSMLNLYVKEMEANNGR